MFLRLDLGFAWEIRASMIGWSWRDIHLDVQCLVSETWSNVDEVDEEEEIDGEILESTETEVLNIPITLLKTRRDLWSLAKDCTCRRRKTCFNTKASTEVWKKIVRRALDKLDNNQEMFVPQELLMALYKGCIIDIPPLGMSLWVIEEIIRMAIYSITAQDGHWGAVQDIMVEAKVESDRAMKKPGILKEKIDPGCKFLKTISKGGRGMSEIVIKPDICNEIHQTLPMRELKPPIRIFMYILHETLCRRGLVDDVSKYIKVPVWGTAAQELAAEVHCLLDLAYCTCISFSLDMLEWYDQIYDHTVSTLDQWHLNFPLLSSHVSHKEDARENHGNKELITNDLTDLEIAFKKGRAAVFWKRCADINSCTCVWSCSCGRENLNYTAQLLDRIKNHAQDNDVRSALKRIHNAAETVRGLDEEQVVMKMAMGHFWHKQRVNFWHKKEHVRKRTLLEGKYEQVVKIGSDYDLPPAVCEDIKEERCPFIATCKGKLRKIMKQLRSTDEASTSFAVCSSCGNQKELNKKDFNEN